MPALQTKPRTYSVRRDPRSGIRDFDGYGVYFEEGGWFVNEEYFSTERKAEDFLEELEARKVDEAERIVREEAV